jgi:DNA mismatch repair protein MutL
LIEVTDDGAGISADELSLAVARHATSKILSADDLFSIHTLDFARGAGTIGSVSILTLTSKTADARTGGRLRVEGGKNGSGSSGVRRKARW